jgi:hypothetical protein
VDEWVFLDRIASQFKNKNRPIPIFNPIFQYSNIPVFQYFNIPTSFMQVIAKVGNENLLVPACPG